MKPCDPIYSNKSSEQILVELIEAKNAPKIHKCSQCDKSFTFSSSLSRHRTQEHSSSSEISEPIEIEEKEEENQENNIKQPLIDFALYYKTKKEKYIEECEAKWKEVVMAEKHKEYMKECMDKFYIENNRRREYAKVHKLVNHGCLTPNCTTQASSPKYKGYCFYCFVHQFPDEPITRNFKVKEQHVHDFIAEQYQDREFTYNKTIRGGCSRKVPDWFFECLTHSVVVENDENQHVSYSCENKRTMELFQDLGNRPIVFIRFNPDSYIDEEDNEVKSSFKYHSSLGVPMIRDKDEWNSRLKKLKDTLDYHLHNIPTKEVTVENLFYDKNV
jgi:hypothetical protein